MRAYLSSFDKWRNWGQERLKSYLESLLGSGSPTARTRPAWCPHSSVLSLTCLLYAHPKETGSPSLDWSGHLGEVLQPNPDFEVSWFSLKVRLAKKVPSYSHLGLTSSTRADPPIGTDFFFQCPKFCEPRAILQEITAFFDLVWETMLYQTNISMNIDLNSEKTTNLLISTHKSHKWAESNNESPKKKR